MNPSSQVSILNPVIFKNSFLEVWLLINKKFFEGSLDLSSEWYLSEKFIYVDLIKNPTTTTTAKSSY